MAKKRSKMKLKPVQFNFSEEAYDNLEALKNRLSVSTKTEVVRLSLAVLSWVVGELEKGHTILVEKEPGKATELAFPFLKVRKEEVERAYKVRA